MRTRQPPSAFAAWLADRQTVARVAPRRRSSVTLEIVCIALPVAFAAGVALGTWLGFAVAHH